MQLPKEQIEAIEQFMLQRVVPVLYDGPTLDQIGTGTLFDLNGRLFFVTAGHIFDDCKPELLALPTNPLSSDLDTLGRYELHRPTDENIDLAVLELLEYSIVSQLRKGWQALSLVNVARCEAEATFVVCGYPSELVRKRGERLSGTLMSAYTERCRDIPPNAKEPVDPSLDLFFHYDSSGENIRGETIATPHLGGTSGSSIWQYKEPPDDGLWTPEGALKIVGVQSAFREGEYARAKNWSYVLSAFQKIDPSLVIPAVPAYS